jgi:adhesin transport system membrane fusion protein
MTGFEVEGGVHAPPEEKLEASEKISPTTHSVFALCAVLIISFVIWANYSTLDIVSMTTGEVIPSTQVKTIQHLEGGIVREILVREGGQVKQGDTLVILEPAASGADVGELSVRLNSLRGDIARLEALVKGLDKPVFPEDLVAANPVIVAQSQRRFTTLRQRYRSEVAQQMQTASQRRLEINEIKTRIRTGRSNLKLVGEQISISEALLRDNLSNRFKHLDLLKEASQLAGGIEQDQAGLPRADAALKGAQAGLESITSNFNEDNQRGLDEAYLNFAELNQRVQKFQDSLTRTVVRSPVDGTVKTIYVFTIGGVLKPGDPVADIVPTGDRLIIEAKLPTQDIGYIHVGQKVKVNLASADAARFGALKGEVVQVSPDALITPEGMPFYKVRIVTESDRFERGSLKYALFPGMQVAANIQTGTRTVFEYLTDRYWVAVDTALQER